MNCQPESRKYEGLIDSLMYSREDLFGTVLENTDKYELQIIYTQIDRDSLNRPFLTTHRYRVNAKKYFYPASAIKLPVALLALEKVNMLQNKGITLYTPLKIDSLREKQIAVHKDTTAQNGFASIGHYIRKVFLVSDNDAFNRLYEFLGQEYINKTLWHKGYKDVLIGHKLQAGLTAEDNRYTNRFVFFNEKGDTLYRQEMQYNDKEYTAKVPIQKGEGYIDDKGNLVKKPMDFSEKNYISLEILHQLLIHTIFPTTASEKANFNFSKEDYRFLYQLMSEFPRESQFPTYKYEKYPDSFVKFFILGNSKQQAPQRLRIFNKIGMAYGFMIDNAYIIDTRNNVEFFLSAVIYVNENQIFNDDTYEYTQIGFPFMKHLGELFYLYERQRTKRFVPDLSDFIVEYN